MKAVIQNASLYAADDTSKHTHVKSRIKGRECRGQDEIADAARKACRAIAVLGKSHGNTDGEDQRKVIKDCATGPGDKGDIKDIRRTEPKQQGRSWKYHNRQHQRPADALQVCKHFFHYILSHLLITTHIFFLLYTENSISLLCYSLPGAKSLNCVFCRYAFNYSIKSAKILPLFLAIPFVN